MTDEMKFTAIGAYLYGALYLVGVFVAGVAFGNFYAVLLSLAACGAAYLTQVAMVLRPTQTVPMYGAALLLSAASGLSLAI